MISRTVLGPTRVPRSIWGRRLAFLATSSLAFYALFGGASLVSANLSGAIYTSNFDGSIINQNLYALKSDVYLTGGPCQGGSHLDPGDYYFEVTSPSGVLLSSDAIGNRLYTIGANGFIASTSGTHGTNALNAACIGGGITVQLLPFNDTPNPGGEYKFTIASKASVEECSGFSSGSTTFEICNGADSKSDNFKVGPEPLPAHLTLVKQVVGGEASASEWTLSATGPTTLSGAGGASGDVPAGTYSLAESAGPANYSPGNWGCDGGAQVDSTITLAAGGSATCTITNTFVPPPLPGSITIVKHALGGDGTFDFTGFDDGFSITTSGGTGSTSFGELDSGEYTVTESGPPAGWTFTSLVCTGTNESSGEANGQTANVTLTQGGSVTCTFTNTFVPPPAHLTLVKVVDGQASASEWTLSATGPATLSGAGGASGDVPAGTYSLAESAGPANYTPGFWGCDGGAQVGSTITLAAGGNATCTITNTFTPPPPPPPPPPTPTPTQFQPTPPPPTPTPTPTTPPTPTPTLPVTGTELPASPTLPSTSTVDGSTGNTGGSMALILVLLAIGSIGIVVLSPLPRRTRR